MSPTPLRRLRWVALAIALAACGAPRTEPPPPRGPDPSPVRIEKPSAPVAVALSTRSLGSGDYDVTLTARPTRDVAALELIVDGRREQLGPVRAGEQRSLTVRVALAGQRGRDVVAAAATGAGNRRRTRAAVVRVGAPAAEKPQLPVHVITLSDGTELAEVRP